MSIYGSWKDAVITISVDDDLTAEVDLGRDYEGLNIIIPTIDAANVSIMVAEQSGGTYYDLGQGQVINAGTGGFADSIELGGYQFIKVKTSAPQTANRTFRVRGYRA